MIWTEILNPNNKKKYTTEYDLFGVILMILMLIMFDFELYILEKHILLRCLYISVQNNAWSEQPFCSECGVLIRNIQMTQNSK